MMIRCEECDIDLTSRDVYFDGTTSRCVHCDAPLGSGGRGRPRKGRRAAGKAVVPLPDEIQVSEEPARDGGQRLVLRVPWRLQRPQDGPQLFAWGVVGAMGLVALQAGVTKLDAAILVVLASIVLLTVQQLNQTVITVWKGRIQVSHRPMPWLGRVLAADQLAQLYVDKRPVAQNTFDYNVRAQLESGRDVVFLRALKEPAVALYLEQCIEDHLQIVDRRVTGEYIASEPPPPALDQPSPKRR